MSLDPLPLFLLITTLLLATAKFYGFVTKDLDRSEMILFLLHLFSSLQSSHMFHSCFSQLLRRGWVNELYIP